MYILLRRFTHLNTFFLHDPIWMWQSNVRQSKTLTNFRYSSLIIVVALEEAQVASLQKELFEIAQLKTKYQVPSHVFISR